MSGVSTDAVNPPMSVDPPESISPTLNNNNSEIEPKINLGGLSTNKIDVLKEDNWEGWKDRITTLFQLHDVNEYVDGTVIAPPVDDKDHYKAWKRKDLVAQALIKINVSDGQIIHVTKAADSATMWRNLCAIHEVHGYSSITAAKRTFYNTHAEEGANIPEHINELRKQQNKLHSMGCEISDEEFKLVLIMSLPPSWDSYMAAYFGALPKNKKGSDVGISSAELTSLLIDEYRRRPKQTGQEFMYKTQYTRPNKKRKISPNNTASKKKCEICGRTNHTTAQCRFKGKPKCGKCGRFGHETEKHWDKPPNIGSKERANIAQTDIGDAAPTAYITDVPMAESSDVDFYPWFADSATTSHITNTRDAFIEYTPILPKEISGVGKTPIYAYGRGVVEVTSVLTNNNKTKNLKLHNVLYVPDARDNLLSLAKLDDAGGRTQFGNNKCILINANNEVIAEGTRSGGLYLLNLYRKREQIYFTNTTTPQTWESWHRRYGHISISGLQTVLNKNLVDGFTVDRDSQIHDCVACIQAKQTHKPFPKKATSRSITPGELTHTDVWGPSRTTSLLGMRYNIVFIDDATRHGLTQQIKTKDETSSKIRQYLIFIQHQYGHKPKRVRIDQGREYLNNEFKNWCAEQGIQIEPTAPYSPSQNGVAERYNRTLAELARAMLIARNIPTYLWDHAINHAHYVRNRAYTRALPEKTPQEGWTGNRPNVSHFQEFGTAVWILREGQKLSKLEPKSQKHIFIGFVDGSKAIKYYDTNTKQIKTSRNFHFEKLPPNIQFEGEKECTQIEYQPGPNTNKQNQKRKQRDERDDDESPQRSKRPRIQPDYRLLNDPFADEPELAELVNDPEEEGILNSAEIINVAHASLTSEDPQTLQEAKRAPEWPDWDDAIHTELKQHQQRKTWELTNIPPKRKPIKNKWVFVRKYDREGIVTKFKARLVAKGYSQIPGLDYFDTYSPVVRLETVRALLALATVEDWEIQQMDVKGAYLNGTLKEEIYMNQPDGYTDGTKRVCRLLKPLYGLKQSGREWYHELNIKFNKHGHHNLHADPCVFIRKTDEGITLITVWVDDLLAFASTVHLMEIAKKEISQMFEITDLGEPNKIVGIEITRDRAHKTLTITQTGYIENILAKYNLQDANPVSTPMDPNIKLEPGDPDQNNRSNEYASLIGSLMFLTVATRPDIAFAVNRLASFTANPKLSHWTAAKRVLRYLKGTKHLGIKFSKPEGPQTENTQFFGYCDASHANNHDRTSISDIVLLLAGAALISASRKQNTVALSTTEAEYICSSDIAREVKWLRNLFMEVGYPQHAPTIVYGDNLGAQR